MKLIAVKANDGGLKGNIAVVAVGIIASGEIVENEEIIANTLVNGTVSGIFSFAGLKITDLLDNSLRGIKAGMEWEQK